MRFDEIPQSIIEQARAGSHPAMESLCEMILPGAHAVLLSMLRNGDDAADALQDALIRMVRFLPGLRDASLFPGWLMRMLINQANTHRKKAQASIIDVSSLSAEEADSRLTTSSSPVPSPRAAASASEIGSYINRAVLDLPPRQKIALVLFEMEHLSIRQVAQVMELTDGAVKFHLHEARKNLKKRLVELGISPEELCGEEAT